MLDKRTVQYIMAVMDISIVIPVYNESAKIGGDITAASGFLSAHGMSGEIIVVDDCSVDNTAQAVRDAGNGVTGDVTVRVVESDRHHGKGFAVRSGVAVSSGDYVMFADSGCCVPYENALRGLEMLRENKCEIAHGSRKLAGSVITRKQTPYRRFCGMVFHRLVTWWMNIPAGLSDTQCGFKVYRGDVARQLFGECECDGFVFDVEIILLAMRKGYVIEEFAIEWTCDRDSRLTPARNVRSILGDLADIRRRSGGSN